MPRERKREDFLSRSNRYTPFYRRRLYSDSSSSESDNQGPSVETHADPVARYNSILGIREPKFRQSAGSDTSETLTADEAFSDSSNDSGIVPELQRFDKNMIFKSWIEQPFQAAPQVEPMEVVAEQPIAELPLAVEPVAQPLAPHAVVNYAGVEDGDASESCSHWSSDEDEEIQRACLQDMDEADTSDDEGDDGRVSRIESYRDHLAFLLPGLQIASHGVQPPRLEQGHRIEEYQWPAPPNSPRLEVQEVARPSTSADGVELMDQDDDSAYGYASPSPAVDQTNYHYHRYGHFEHGGGNPGNVSHLEGAFMLAGQTSRDNHGPLDLAAPFLMQ